jgi:hypothetical protein
MLCKPMFVASLSVVHSMVSINCPSPSTVDYFRRVA